METTNDWYMMENGQRVGPLPLTEILWRSGDTVPLIWRHGMTEWVAGTKLAETAGFWKLPHVVSTTGSASPRKGDALAARKQKHFVFRMAFVVGGCVVVWPVLEHGSRATDFAGMADSAQLARGLILLTFLCGTMLVLHSKAFVYGLISGIVVTAGLVWAMLAKGS